MPTRLIARISLLVRYIIRSGGAWKAKAAEIGTKQIVSGTDEALPAARREKKYEIDNSRLFTTISREYSAEWRSLARWNSPFAAERRELPAKISPNGTARRYSEDNVF